MTIDERVLNKLDKIEDRLDRIDVTLVQQHEQLSYHIKRTNLLEESVEALRSEVKPIQKHVTSVETVLKALGALAAVVSVAAGVVKILEFLASR